MSETGKRVRTARERRGWSQEALAAAAGVSQTTIDKIEQGRTLKSRFLPNIAMALELPLEEIDPTLLAPSIASGEKYEYFRFNTDENSLRLRKAPDIPVFVSTSFRSHNEILIGESPAEMAWRPRILDYSEGAYGILITFPHMKPELDEGDTAFFDRTFPLRPGATGCFLRKPFIERIGIIARLVDTTDSEMTVRIWQSADDLTLRRSEWSDGDRLACKHTRR